MALAFVARRPGGGDGHADVLGAVQTSMGCKVALALCDQGIRENPARRGTETSAEVLVGPPGRMVNKKKKKKTDKRVFHV